MRLVSVAAMAISAALWGLSAATGLGGPGGGSGALGSATTLSALAAAAAAVGMFFGAADLGFRDGDRRDGGR